MARPKKVVEETNLKEIPLEDLALEEIEELPAMPEIPVEEQIKIATEELEKKNIDLNMALANKEHEIEVLKQQLVNQEHYYNNAIARLVLSTYGG